MPLVKVKAKYQVTLPTAVREQVGVDVGDLLEAHVERGKITLTPKTVVDREIAEGLADIKKGRTYGPFSSAEELLHSLHRNVRKMKKKSKSAA
ncbi:MAG: AbrB/MazE/SpoVT family DNA-binding domain-containing protein [Acidobacteria bacterium]|nr:AbrB/MazE/SpoVT family DNA-binding domain-containing protein [Acidobacteriota bacterium]